MNKRFTFAATLLVSVGLLFWMGYVILSTGSADGEILGSSLFLGVGLIFWAAGPWVKKSDLVTVSLPIIAVGVVFFAIGSGARIGMFMALGWVLISIQAIKSFSTPKASAFRLGLMLFFAVPWLLMDLEAVGWWFRLSAAIVSEYFFGCLGFETSRNGTFLEVEGLNVSVEEACSGLRQFHMLLFTGVSLAVRKYLKPVSFWFTLLVLPVLAWVTNTVRVVFITAVGMAFGVEFASGMFHEVGGLFVVSCMFLLTWLLVEWLQPKEAFA